MLEAGEISRGPLGGQAAFPVLRVGLLLLKLLAAVGSTRIGGVGCHSDGYMVGVGVGRERSVLMHSCGEFGACK